MSANAAPTLEQVVMGTSGVGWLGYGATLDGTGRTELDVPAADLDDALKSLTIFADGLKVRQVTVEGDAAYGDPYHGLPLGPDAARSLADLLGSLRGASVRIEGEPTIAGRIVGVERRDTTEDGAQVTHIMLVVDTSAGLVSVDLDDAGPIRLEDEAARSALDRLLDRSARTRENTRRQFSIVTDGAAGSAIKVGLLTAVPVWKPTWRLVLGADATSPARLQGWAVIENRTGQPWRQVHLTLVDGPARALRQELSKAWFVDRQVIPVVAGPIRPLVPFGTDAAARAKGGAPLAMMAPSLSIQADEMAGVEASPASEASLATSFRIEAPVDVPDGGSLMAPLLDRPIDAERIALVPAYGAGGNPDSAVAIANTTTTTLPRGILTVIDRDRDGGILHVGDGVLPVLPAGGRAQVAFGADRKITYTLTEDQKSRISRLAVAGGVMTLTSIERHQRRWAFTSADDAARHVVVELPFDPNVRPAEPTQVRRDGDHWYVDGQLAPRGEVTLDFATEQPLERKFQLLGDAALADVLLELQATELPAAWQGTIDEIAELAQVRETAATRLQRADAERERIGKEQDRLRANLESVKEAGPLRERWLTELAGQEDRLAALAAERDQAQSERDAAEATLRNLVKELGP